MAMLAAAMRASRNISVGSAIDALLQKEVIASALVRRGRRPGARMPCARAVARWQQRAHEIKRNSCT